MNRVGQVLIIGSDETPEIRRYLEKGVVAASIVRDSRWIGLEAMRSFARLRDARGEPKAVEAGFSIATPQGTGAMILGTVRRKIIANSTMVLLITGSATFYTGLASSELARSVIVFFRNNQLMNDVRRDLVQTESSLTGYLTSKSTDSLKDYIRFSTKLGEDARQLNREIRQDESLLLQRNLAGLIDSYLEDAEASVTAKRGRDVKGYTERYESSEQDADLAKLLITRIEGIFIADSLKAFSGFNATLSAVLATNAVLVLSATVLGLALLVAFSYKLTSPLSKLAEAARAVGRGEYDYELPQLDTHDEIGTTTAGVRADAGRHPPVLRGAEGQGRAGEAADGGAGQRAGHGAQAQGGRTAGPADPDQSPLPVQHPLRRHAAGALGGRRPHLGLPGEPGGVHPLRAQAALAAGAGGRRDRVRGALHLAAAAALPGPLPVRGERRRRRHGGGDPRPCSCSRWWRTRSTTA